MSCKDTVQDLKKSLKVAINTSLTRRLEKSHCEEDVIDVLERVRIKISSTEKLIEHQTEDEVEKINHYGKVNSNSGNSAHLPYLFILASQRQERSKKTHIVAESILLDYLHSQAEVISYSQMYSNSNHLYWL